MDQYSLTEIAQALGISRQATHRRIVRLDLGKRVACPYVPTKFVYSFGSKDLAALGLVKSNEYGTSESDHNI